MSDGIGCTCHARSESECCCDVDWTPQEIYELRQRVAELTDEVGIMHLNLAACEKELAVKQQQVNAFYGGNPKGGVVADLEQKLATVEKERDMWKETDIRDAARVDELAKQFAASQAREQQLRDALEKIARVNAMDYEYQKWAQEALHIPHDTSALDAITKPLHFRIEELHQICRDAYEVYAGSEGIPTPETAAEAYVYQLLMQMKDEIARGLK